LPAALRWTISRLSSSLWIFRIVSRRCLRFISRQWGCVGWLFFSFGLDSMLVAFLCQIQLGPARLVKTTQSPQRGRAAFLFRTTPATIYIIANTGAMLDFGQKRTIGIAALFAEPGCDLILAAPDSPPTFNL